MEPKLAALQNLTLEILARPNSGNLQELLSEISVTGSEALQEYQRCLIFPVVKVLRKRQNADQQCQELCLRVLVCVFSRTKITAWTEFRDVAGCVCIVIKDFLSSSTELQSLDEAFALELMATVSAALRSCQPDVFAVALSDPKSLFEVLWSNVVFESVEVIQKFAARSVKLSAFALVHEMTLPCLNVPGYSRERKQLGSIFAAFLPGISATCARVITKPGTAAYVGGGLIKQALRTFSAIICLIFDDDSSIKQNADDVRTEKWLQETLPKLSSVIGNLGPVLASEDFDVRIALVQFTDQVAATCVKSLKPLLPVFIRMVVVFSEDSHPDVKQIALDFLGSCTRILDAKEYGQTWDVLQEDLVAAFSSLPGLLRVGSQGNKINLLKVCCGYLRLFADNLPVVLSSGDICQQFVRSLTAICVFDEKLFDLMGYFDPCQDLSNAPCHFLYLTEPEAVSLFFEACRRLGYHSRSAGIVEFLMDTFEGSETSNRNGTILVMNWVLRGIFTSDIDHNADDVRRNQPIASAVLELYTSSDLWYVTTAEEAAVLSKRCLPSSEADQQSNEPSLLMLKNRLLSLCLLMDGISIVAQALGRKFVPLLHSSLYYLLEKSEAEMPVVRNRALLVLDSIARSCGYLDVSDLVTENAEYLVSAIIRRLRHLHRHPKAVVTLKAILNHCSSAILPLALKVVNVVLEKLDEFHSIVALPFAVVLATVMKRLKEWVPSKMESTEVFLDPVDEALKYLKDGYFGIKEAPVSKPEDTETFPDATQRKFENGDLNSDSAKEETKDIPEYVKVTVEILKRCAYILPVDDRNLRCVNLGILLDGCEVLRPWQEQLLPVIHKIWLSIIMLHRNSDLIILRKAFECLCEMSKVAGTFLRYRVSHEIVPIIARFLLTEARKSVGARCDSDEYSPNRSLQMCFLKNLAAFLKHIDAEDSVYEVIASACSFYLDTRQPESLQKAAVMFFRDLAVEQPDLVFVKLIEMQSEVTELVFERQDLPVVNVQRSRKQGALLGANFSQVVRDIPCSTFVSFSC